MNKADMMLTDMGAIYIAGWDAMVLDHPTRAATLQAMANLQIRAFMQDGQLPTQVRITHEVAEKGLSLADGTTVPIKISPTSQQTINRHIMNLIETGHVVTRSDYETNKRGRGGPDAPWLVVAIRDRLRATAGIPPK